MSIQKEIDELNLNAAIIDLSSKIKKAGIKFDEKNQAVLEANDENGLLPEGVTLKQLRQQDKHLSHLVSAAQRCRCS